jgi:hypothetical protein
MTFCLVEPATIAAEIMIGLEVGLIIAMGVVWLCSRSARGEGK